MRALLAILTCAVNVYLGLALICAIAIVVSWHRGTRKFDDQKPVKAALSATKDAYLLKPLRVWLTVVRKK